MHLPVQHNQDVFADDVWMNHQEGQLSIDVAENEKTIIIRSTIAGVKAEDLDITLSPDTITIRGSRATACKKTKNEIAHVQECYWGAFSRSIVLPHTVSTQGVDAKLEGGILTITLKKTDIPSQVKVKEVEI